MRVMKKSTVLVSIFTIVALVCLWTSESGSISTTKKQLDLKSGPSVSSDSLNFIKYTPIDGVTGKSRTPYWKPAAREVGVTISATVYGHGYAKATMTSASIGSWSLKGSEYSTANAGSAPVVFGVTIQRMGEATVSHTTTSELIHKAKGNYNWSANGNVERFAGEWREGSSSGFFNFGTTGKWHFVGVGSNNGSGNGDWGVIYYNKCDVVNCGAVSENPLTFPHKLKTWNCGHTTMGCLKGSCGDTTVPCPLGPNNQTCSYGSYYPCSPHTCSYPPSGSTPPSSGSTPPSNGGSNPPSGSTPPSGGSTPPTGSGSTPPPPPDPDPEPTLVPCSACQVLYNPNVTADDDRHRERTCRYWGCGNKWRKCQSAINPLCNHAVRKRHNLRCYPRNP